MASLADTTVGNRNRARVTSRAARIAVPVVAVTAATLLHLVRQRGVPVWNSLWAEDGRVFLSDALRNFPGTFFAENGGYVHVVPRSIAGIVAQLPVRDAAAGMAVGAALVIALVAAFVYLASTEVFRSRLARLGLAAAVVFLPIPGSELLANTTNLHFYLLFGCFWALLWQEETRFALGTRGVVAAVAALSDPLCALFLPLAIVPPLVHRRRRALLVPGVFAVALVVQFAIIAGGARPQRNWGFRLSALPDIFSYRVAGGLLVGDRYLGHAWSAYGRGFAYGALLVVTAVLTGLLLRSDRRRVAFSLLALGYGGLFFCVQLVGRGTVELDPEVQTVQLNAARYVLLPFLLTTAVILALVDALPETRAGAVSRWIRYAGLLWLAALLAVNFSLTTDRSRGPRWDRQLAAVRSRCAAQGTRNVSVLVSPSPPHVWYATIPCRRL